MTDEPIASGPSEHPIVARIKSGQVPKAAKLNAARGLLPIPAEDLLGLLVFLLSDGSTEVGAAAGKTLSEFPEGQLLPVLSSDLCRSEVLDHFARHPRTMAVSETVLLNPSTSDGAIEELASTLSPHLLEILIRNEVRLIRDPLIMDRIEANPQASPATKKRCQEIRSDFLRKPEAAAPPIAAPPAAAAEPATQEEPEVAVAIPEGLDKESEEAIKAAMVAPMSEAVQAIMELEKSDDREPTTEKKLTLEQKLMKMSVPDKIKLAYLGGRQCRMLLIKDPNRTVSNTVISGGKISAQEIELVVQFRNIDDEILRKIATKKQFMKVYNIVHNLVKNPRTPIGVAMPLVGRLSMPDLKRLENNANVSGSIREFAKKLARQIQSQAKK